MTLEESRNLIKQNNNGHFINRGLVYESRLKMFTEPLFEADLKAERGWFVYTDLLKRTLTEKKFDRILDFQRFPLKVVDISETCLTELYKVFEAHNSYFHIEATKESDKSFQEEISSMDLVSKLKEIGKSVLKNKPNTILVLDQDENGNPYIVEVYTERVRGFELNEDGSIEHLSFVHSYDAEGKENIAFYCSEYYRVFQLNDGEPTLISETPHRIGYCPASFIISEKVNSKDCFNRKTPLTSSVSSLEEWQIFETYKFYTDHYAPFPVIEMAEQDCSVEGCENGIITEEDTMFEDGVAKPIFRKRECTDCGSKNLIGAGTIIEVDAKQDRDDENNAGVFRFITPDIKNLEYLGDKLSAIETYIQVKTIGVNTDADKQAFNEMQVKGSFESRESILLGIKTDFDNIYKWIVETVYKSKKGANSYVGVHADFGTEYFLTSETELQDRFKGAKEIGLPETEIESIYRQLVQTKYKTNPKLAERMALMCLLDPMPYDNLNGKKEKMSFGVVSRLEFIISTRLLSFIKRFELQNGDIMQFGMELELRQKVDKINLELNKYANEYKDNQAEQISDGNNGHREVQRGANSTNN